MRAKPWLVVGWLGFAFAVAHAEPMGEKKASKVEVPAMAFLGDSISTGALASPHIAWDLEKLDKVLSDTPYTPAVKEYSARFQKVVPNQDEKVLPPRRLWEEGSERGKYLEVYGRESIFGRFVDIEEASWGYLLGRLRGVDPASIWIAAEDGNHSGDSIRQAARLLRNTKNVLPESTFLFFTGNDVCAWDLTKTEAFVAHYIANIEKMIGVLLKGKPKAGEKSTIYVLSHFGIEGWLDSKDVQNKQVYAYGKMRSCAELRRMTPPDESEKIKKLESPTAKLAKSLINLEAAKNLPENSSLCRTVLATDPDAPGFAERLKKIDGGVQGIRKALAGLVEKLAKARRADVEIKFVQAPEDFKPKAEDIANDCFHLSLRGQERLAESIDKSI